MNYAGVLAGVICLAPMTALSQEAIDKSSKALFQEGIRLFAEEQYLEAAEQIRAAHAARPSYKIFYNIGQAEAAAKRYGVALESFEKYLSEGGDDIDRARQAEVQEELARLRAMTGVIEVQGEEGMEIRVDGTVRGRFPETRRIPVAATVVHRVSGALGAEVVEERVRVSGGDTMPVDLRLAKAKGAAPSAESRAATSPSEEGNALPMSDTAPPKRRRLLVAGLSLAGAGLAAVVAGSICGGLVLNKEGMLERRCEDGVCTEAERDIIESRDRLLVSSAVLWGTGGAMAATGLVLILVATLDRETPKVVLMPTLGGLTMTGRF